jgi:hypothetical protein
VAEVYACLQKLFHRNYCHVFSSLGYIKQAQYACSTSAAALYFDGKIGRDQPATPYRQAFGVRNA